MKRPLTHVFFAWVALLVYLFVSAPQKLPDTKEVSNSKLIPVQNLFRMMQTENAAMRKLWTQEIVGEGKKQGLNFHENWKEKSMEAGPLPALFLRETAQYLEKSPIPLSLFLGSSHPIRDANRFDPMQMQKFERIRESGEPQFFFSADIERHTGMFADIASAQACVDCHNQHENSPKKDWKLNDVMGATTWLYPAENVTLEEALKTLSVLRSAFRHTYGLYLEKLSSFKNPPLIGSRWPKEGFFIPDLDTYMAQFEKGISEQTLQILLQVSQNATVQ